MVTKQYMKLLIPSLISTHIDPYCQRSKIIYNDYFNTLFKLKISTLLHVVISFNITKENTRKKNKSK